MNKTTLVVMAAGMGSRYGGIKQLEHVGPAGEIIMDYSIHDAVRAGFDKVVFIIRKDIEEAFRETIGDSISRFVETEYVFQSLDDLPEGFSVPDGRSKPWGTAQAVLCCKDVVDTPFLVINADDYYGVEGFKVAHEYLANEPAKGAYCMVGFELGNTLSENGTVTRGVCQVSEDGFLTDVVENFGLIRKGDVVINDAENEYALDTPVSMNMWGFTTDIFAELQERFVGFLKESGTELKSEYLLPTEVGKMIVEGKVTVKVLSSSDQWFGVTYREDKPTVVERFEKLKEAGVYTDPIFADLEDRG
ncbi:MAG: nucleotidyltransferase [Lachnospiraceae bacterium]|nr:nucleotidyltransferase [Lachnospiraceae bacterium]